MHELADQRQYLGKPHDHVRKFLQTDDLVNFGLFERAPCMHLKRGIDANGMF